MTKQELAIEAAKAVPPGSTITLSLFGIPLSQWAILLSIIVMLVQLGFMIYNQSRRNKKNGKQPD